MLTALLCTYPSSLLRLFWTAVCSCCVKGAEHQSTSIYSITAVGSTRTLTWSTGFKFDAGRGALPATKETDLFVEAKAIAPERVSILPVEAIVNKLRLTSLLCCVFGLLADQALGCKGVTPVK